jgi:ArsR family metal-binding transcriptional regulator
MTENEIKPIEEQKTVVNEVEIVLQKFQDTSNIYFCSECRKFIRPDVEKGEFFWYVPLTGATLCGTGSCKRTHMRKLLKKIRQAENVDLTKKEEDPSDET